MGSGIAAAFVLAGTWTLFAADAKQQKEFTPQQKRWWAFQKVVNPPVPAVANKAWVRNPVDSFILAKLEEKGIAPSREADKATLLRRLSLDLIGLPPTPEELQAFLSDASTNAYEKQVERLLASPRYGERWGRHWLDLARYADSNGFKADETRPHVWRYRDYVIKSFNQDKPYDRFVREQIAGDEMFPGDLDAKVAVGFNRHFPDESNAANIMQRRQELLNDITDTVGATFLGMTVGCARCHDHKFDPILHKDYYRLSAFFANTRLEDDAVLYTPEQQRSWQEKNALWEAKTETIRAEMKQLLKAPTQAMYAERLSRFPEDIQEIIGMKPEQRSPYQWHMYLKAKDQIEFTDDEMAKKLKGDAAKRYKALELQLAAFNDIKPETRPIAQTLTDWQGAPPTTHVLTGGNYVAPQYEVQPGFLTILDPSDAKINGNRRRTALAEWLTNKDNPLTARVMVNRIWHHHFGRGIAGTPSDFGVMGERPTHKELLDYLASTFVEKNWSIKEMHRMMVTSAAYRQDSGFNEVAAKVDPENKYLWRFQRRRLEGESVRDSMLAVSGALNEKMGGPGVFPPLPPGLSTRGGWKSNEDPSESNRRSVYIFVRRNTRYPMLEAFDMPDTHESCARRAQTTTASQSLELLNSEVVLGWSRDFAARVSNDSGLSEDAQIDRAFKLAYARPASASERKISHDFLTRQERITGSKQQALSDFCHMLFNSNEFLYLN
jgi:hypothetical protein